MVHSPRPASANHVVDTENANQQATDSAILPLSLLASLLTQFFLFGLIAVFTGIVGRTAVSGVAVFAMLAAVAIYRMLATRSTVAWRAACRCAATALVVLAILTLVAATKSAFHGGLGIIACLMQLHYLMALKSAKAHEFFNADQNSELREHCDAKQFPGVQAEPNDRRWTVANSSVRCLSLFAVLLLWMPVSHAQDTPSGELEKLLAKIPDSFAPQRDNVISRLIRYRDFSKSNKAAAENELTVRLRNATQTSGAESHEAIAIDATLKWLRDDGAPPRSTASMAWVVSYAENLARQQAFVWKDLSILLTKFTRAGLHEEAATLHTAFRRLESSREPSQSVLHGRKFKGYRTTTDGKKLISISVNVSDREGSDDEFVGRIERDFMYRGHPVHHITGQFVGVHVMIQTGSVIDFGGKSDHAWTYHGCVIGRSIIGRYTGRDSKGKPKGGLFHIRTGR